MTKPDLTYFSQLATRALYYELALTPKPGLVDRADAGAHHDMDFYTFIRSATALSPYFETYLALGYQLAAAPAEHIFQALRQAGQAAEAAMFKATDGINTHKGVNFSLALLLGATGTYLAQTPGQAIDRPWTLADHQAIRRLVQAMTSQLLAQDLSQLQQKTHLTHGEQLYLNYGFQGPRGEAAKGFPTLYELALPFFREQLAQHGDSEWAQLQLLLYLMSQVEDGNLIHRGGIVAWQTVKAECQKAQQEQRTKDQLIDFLTTYNQTLIHRYLSPGGTADLLALTLYLASLEQLI